MTDDDDDLGNVTELPTLNPAVPALEDRDWITTQELVNESGITYRQADYWIRTGLLHAVDDRPGFGVPRQIPKAQAGRARVVRELLDAGMALQTIRDTVDEIQRDGRITLGPVTITIDQED